MKKMCILLIIATSLCISGCSGYEKASNIVINSNLNDNQSFWNSINYGVAKEENGYYYLASSLSPDNPGVFAKLYYMDSKTKQSILVCDKPECNHRNVDCNACFTSKYNCQNIYYYNNYLYVVENDQGTGESFVVRIDKDGNNRKKLFSVGEVSVAYRICFYDECAYVYMSTNYSTKINIAELNKYSLKDGSKECIYLYEGFGAVFSSVKNYGGNIFFIVSEIKANNETNTYEYNCKGVFVFEENSGEVTKIIENNVSDYTIDIKNNIIYYFVMGDGIYKKQIDKGAGRKIYNCEKGLSEYCEISYDGKYLYINNELNPLFYDKNMDFYLWVFDTDGKELNRIETLGRFSTLFGDENFAFCAAPFGQDKGKYYVIPKSEITEAKEWNALPQ